MSGPGDSWAPPPVGGLPAHPSFSIPGRHQPPEHWGPRCSPDEESVCWGEAGKCILRSLRKSGKSWFYSGLFPPHPILAPPNPVQTKVSAQSPPLPPLPSPSLGGLFRDFVGLPGIPTTQWSKHCPQSHFTDAAQRGQAGCPKSHSRDGISPVRTWGLLPGVASLHSAQERKHCSLSRCGRHPKTLQGGYGPVTQCLWGCAEGSPERGGGHL